MEFGTRPSHWPTPHHTGARWRPLSPEQARLLPPRWVSWSGWMPTQSPWRGHRTIRTNSQVGDKRVRLNSGEISHYRTASAMRLLSFLRSVDRRPIRYDGSRPLQKTVPTELSNNNLLSSAAALPRARHTSFMIWGGKGGDVYLFIIYFIIMQSSRLFLHRTIRFLQSFCTSFLAEYILFYHNGSGVNNYCTKKTLKWQHTSMTHFIKASIQLTVAHNMKHRAQWEVERLQCLHLNSQTEMSKAHAVIIIRKYTTDGKQMLVITCWCLLMVFNGSYIKSSVD